MDIEAVRQVHETQIEHTQGLEMWLVRWLVTASDGELSIEERPDGEPRALSVTLRSPP